MDKPKRPRGAIPTPKCKLADAPRFTLPEQDAADQPTTPSPSAADDGPDARNEGNNKAD